MGPGYIISFQIQTVFGLGQQFSISDKDCIEGPPRKSISL